MQVGDLVKFRTKHYGSVIGVITDRCDVCYDSFYVKSVCHPRRFYVNTMDLKVL